MGVLVTQSPKIICRIGTWSYGFRIQDTQLTNQSLVKKTCCKLLIHCRYSTNSAVYTVGLPSTLHMRCTQFLLCVSFLQPTWICWPSRLVNRAGKWHGDWRAKWVMSLWNWVWDSSVAKSACEISQNINSVTCALRFVLQCEKITSCLWPEAWVVAWPSWHWNYDQFSEKLQNGRGRMDREFLVYCPVTVIRHKAASAKSLQLWIFHATSNHSNFKLKYVSIWCFMTNRWCEHPGALRFALQRTSCLWQAETRRYVMSCLWIATENLTKPCQVNAK